MRRYKLVGVSPMKVRHPQWSKGRLVVPLRYLVGAVSAVQCGPLVNTIRLLSSTQFKVEQLLWNDKTTFLVPPGWETTIETDVPYETLALAGDVGLGGDRPTFGRFVVRHL